MTTEAPGDPAGFADLGLRPQLIAALGELGYEEPTPIQREAIPRICGGHDLLGQAATGTGKTAAFALPILQRLRVPRSSGHPIALVLVPTRELAMQVSEAIHKYGRHLGARVLPVFGGQPIVRQFAALNRGVDVVVATPGRAIDHIQRNSLVLDDVELLVLDEADEMLDMGFAEDIEAIIAAVPDSRQTVLFSATLPKRIAALAEQHLRDPEHVRISPAARENAASAHIRQIAYVVPRAHKAAALIRVLDLESPTAAIVFCRTRHDVDELAETLNGRGYRAEALHGGMDQAQRDRVMGRIRSQSADLLVATDVAARGLDIDHLTHVVNFDVPSAPESYVHRIGRVGRAGRDGTAITLAEPRAHRMLKNIEALTKRTIQIEPVPTVDDLRARRIETTTEALRAATRNEDLDRFQAVVDALSDEHDIVEIALAAIALAHRATGDDADEADIPVVALRRGDDRSTRPRSKKFHDAPGGRKGAAPPRFGARKSGGPRSMTRLYVGVGRRGGIRPGDLVGAIAGESSLQGRDIGAIEISEHFSLVEVPDGAAGEVIAALRGTTIKGRKAKVRRDRKPG